MAYSFYPVKSMLQLRQFILLKGQISEQTKRPLVYPNPAATLYVFIENSTNEVNRLGTLELFPILSAQIVEQNLFIDFENLSPQETLWIESSCFTACHDQSLELFMMQQLVHLTVESGFSYGAILTDPTFIDSLEKNYRIPYHYVGKTIPFRGGSATPAIMDLRHVLYNCHLPHFSWLKMND